MEDVVQKYESRLASVQRKLYGFDVYAEKFQSHEDKQAFLEEITTVCLEYRNTLSDYIENINLFTETYSIQLSSDVYNSNMQVTYLQKNNTSSNPSSQIAEFDANVISNIYEFFNFINKWENKFREHQLEESQMYRTLTTNQLKTLEKEIEEYCQKFYETPSSENTHDRDDANSGSVDQSQKLTSADKAKQTNKKITSSLIRSNQVLRGSVLQTELNIEELDTQTSLLDELNEKFEIVNTVLNQSNKLIKIVESSSSQEKKQVYYSLGFLAVCIAWVLWKRIIRGPLKLLLWIWFKFFKTLLFSTGLAKRKMQTYSGIDPHSIVTASLRQAPTVTATDTHLVSSVLVSTISEGLQTLIANQSLVNQTQNASLLANTTLQAVIESQVENIFDEL